MRRKRGDILIKILTLFEQNKRPLTISEISEKISANWETTTTNLDTLDRLGYIQKKEDGNYILIKPFTKDSDTFFKIPIEPKSREITESIFSLVKILWLKLTKTNLNKTRAHKYAVEITQKFKLEAPILWYKYGAIMLLEYNPNKIYELKNKQVNSKAVYDFTYDLISSTKDKTVAQLKDRQYEKKELYALNKEFYKELLNSKFMREKLKDKLYAILFKIPAPQTYPEAYEVIQAFASLFLTLLRINHNRFKEMRSDIIKIYEDVWSVIASINAYESLFECGYSKEFLDMYIDFETILELADQSLSEFKDLIQTPLAVRT